MISVRPAISADIPLLAEIERSAGAIFRGTEQAWVAEDGVTPAETFPPLIGAGLLWVAQRDGRLAGFVGAQRHEDELHILEIAVHQDHQRRGVGRALMQAAIDAAVRAQYSAVTLTTFRTVAWNGPFYASLGFREAAPPSPRLAAILASEAARGFRDRCAMRLVLRQTEAPTGV